MPKHHTPPTQPPEPVPGDRLLTVQETASVLGLAVSTLNRGRVYGTSDLPPYVKLGKAVRYRLSTVQAFIASRTENQHTSQQQQAV